MVLNVRLVPKSRFQQKNVICFDKIKLINRLKYPDLVPQFVYACIEISL